MTKTLDVYLHRKSVGRLIQDDHGLLLFEYDENWLNSPDAIALSISLPLRKRQFRGKECKGFFSGILPEESKRRQIAKNLGISARNDYSMLEQIGGECAGAVTFIPGGQPLPDTDHQYRELNDVNLSRILRELPHRPLMAGEAGVRLSLAGAQDKIAVHFEEGRVSLPLGGAPSTHILKPAIERFEGVVFNEAVCMKLASAVGIPTSEVEFRQVEDIDYLMIKRFDRRIRKTSPGNPAQTPAPGRFLPGDGDFIGIKISKRRRSRTEAMLCFAARCLKDSAHRPAATTGRGDFQRPDRQP